MSNQIIRTKDFEENKNKLKRFSNEFPKDLRIKKVEETTFFGFNKKVTGEDFNIVISQFQANSIENKTVLIKIIEEFKTIYNTFESLDKDYIQSILIAVKSAEESSNQAKKNNNYIGSLISKLQVKFKNIESQHEEITKKLDAVNSAAEFVKSAKYLNAVDATYLQALENKSKIVEVNNKFKKKLSDLQVEIQEVLKVSEDNSTHLYHAYTNKTDKSLDEIAVRHNQLEVNVEQKLKESEQNSTNLYMLYANKTDNSLDDIIVKLNNLKTDVEEKIKLSNVILIKLHKEYANKTNKSLDEITVKQTELKADILERLKISNENYIKTNKEFLFKLKIVSIIAVVSIIFSMSIIVVNLMKNA